MEPIRVVGGTGRGPTPVAAYDAALAAANAHDYNLVTVSSVIPPGASVRTVDRLPDLGTVGDRLTVVEASAVGRERVAAALAWGRADVDGDRPGLFYEAGATDSAAIESVRSAATTGLAAGADLREWDLGQRDVVVERTEGSPGDDHLAAVVLAVYGSGDPLL